MVKIAIPALLCPSMTLPSSNTVGKVITFRPTTQVLLISAVIGVMRVGGAKITQLRLMFDGV